MLFTPAALFAAPCPGLDLDPKRFLVVNDLLGSEIGLASHLGLGFYILPGDLSRVLIQYLRWLLCQRSLFISRLPLSANRDDAF
jgi:hypothetical protein